MAKIFGTSYENESTTQNSKPSTPNTSPSKHLPMAQIPVKRTKSRVNQVFSDSEPKQVESPALESDSDDGLLGIQLQVFLQQKLKNQNINKLLNST